MQLDFKGNKGFRLLNMYERLNRGEPLNKKLLAEQFGVSAKTIQRDLEDLRNYFAEIHPEEGTTEISYDKAKDRYLLVRSEEEWLTNQEILALCKILLESRAFEESEMNHMLDKLISQATKSECKVIEELTKNESFYYVPLRHGKKLLPSIWELSCYINEKEIIDIVYTRMDGEQREHQVKPVAIMFSEFYFYLIAFKAGIENPYPTVFRIDRIQSMRATGEKFKIPYRDKFSDGEFRKRVQFMYSGELKRVRFEYSGPSIEAVLDRLPTAEILCESGGVYTITAEAYGNGIYMWLGSQGEMVKVVE